jgi:hypothetical protein
VTDRGSPAALWAEAFQALASHIAHDFRNTMNGVAVNLEVVRARSARGAEAAAIAPFAATAAAQFEVATAGAEALLGFARSEPAPADVAAIVVRVSRLAELRTKGGMQVNDGSGGGARTSAPVELVRTAVARSVLAALADGNTISCEIAVDDGIFLRVTGVTHTPPPPDPELVAIARAHGVHIVARGQSLELRFPSVDPRAIPHASS